MLFSALDYLILPLGFTREGKNYYYYNDWGGRYEIRISVFKEHIEVNYYTYKESQYGFTDISEAMERIQKGVDYVVHGKEQPLIGS